MNYSLFFILFFNLICFDKIFSSQSEKEFLFEYYWEKKKESLTVKFAALSELKELALTEEGFLEYTKFVERCMQGEDNSIVIYLNHKKTLYICSEDKQRLMNHFIQQKNDYKKRLEDIAKSMKTGDVFTFKNMEKKGADCSMKAEVCPEWDSKDSVLLGYAIKSLAEQGKNGLFSVEGCSVKVLHFDEQGNLDTSKN